MRSQHRTSADTILLSLTNQRDRTQILSKLSREDYEFVSGESPEHVDQSVDLWILDARNFRRQKDAISEFKAEEEPHFFPALLLCPEERLSALASTVWDCLDDVVGLPVTPDILRVRIENLLQRRRLSKRAVTSQKRFESLVNTTSSAVVFLKPDGTIRFVNQACLRLFDYERGELVDEPISTIIPSRLQEAAAQGIERYDLYTDQERTGTLESVGQCKDGSEFPIQLSYSSFELDDEVYLTGIITETTAVKQREARLQVLNRVLRHDIRNDMNVILSYAELLERESSCPTPYVEKILSATEDVVNLSEKASMLETLFNLEAESTERIDVCELIRRKCRQYSQRYPDASVDCEFQTEERVHVEAIPILESAIDNLLENAIEHNDSEVPEIRVVVRAPQGGADVVELEFTDNGPGLPPQEVAVIETNSETSLEHASGLGLWLVNWIISESGGEIQFAQNEPRGASITVRLPTG